MYICLFRLLIVSTHLGITWPNGIIWLTLTIFFSTRYHYKKEIKSTSALKSDNDSSGLKHPGQFPNMQSFELESHVCVSTKAWAVGDNISSNFKFEFIPFAKSEACERKSVGSHCCSYALKYSYTYNEFFSKSSNHVGLCLWTGREWSFSLVNTSTQISFCWKCWRCGWCCFWGWRCSTDL